MENGLKKAMGDKRITIEAIASVLNIHRNSASSKVNKEVQFTIREAFQLKRNLFPEYDMDYLFGPFDASDESKPA